MVVTLIKFNPKCFFNSTSHDDLMFKINEYFKIHVNAFYMLYLGVYDGHHLFKLGKTKDFNDRIDVHMGELAHSVTKKLPVVHHLDKSPYYYEIEETFKRKLWDLSLIVNCVIGGANRVELFKITKEYTIDKIITILNDTIKIVNQDPSLFKYKISNKFYKLPKGHPNILVNIEVEKEDVTKLCDICNVTF